MLGLLGLGALGVLTGRWVQAGLDTVAGAAPVPSALSDLLPGAAGFRYYSVTGAVQQRSTGSYQLSVGGLVQRPATLSYADLLTLPQATLTADFQCVTGWRVPGVHWAGVRLSDLLEHVGVGAGAKALRLVSYDGVYTESLTLSQARRPDMLVAHSMDGAVVSHDHGGPVRLVVGPMYGYKSLKWLGGVEVVDRVEPGYWEQLGYDVDAWVGRSNGRTDPPTA